MKHITPQRLFLLFALPFGLLFVFLTPPFGGGDEQHHFLRSFEIVSGQLAGYSEIPQGFVDLQKNGLQFYNSALQQHHYDPENLAILAAIPLHSHTTLSHVSHTFFVGQFPLAHLTYLPGMLIGTALEMNPFYILYLCRITGLLMSLLLVYHAIRLSPFGGYILCAIALLPSPSFYRSFMHTDGFMLGLSFLFFAALSKWLVRGEEKIRPRNILALSSLGLMLAPLKTCYALMLAVVLLIPKSRFTNMRTRMKSIATMILPGWVSTAIWLLVIRQHMPLVTYTIDGSGIVSISDQIQHILSHPFSYITMVMKHFFSTNFFQWMVEILSELGWSTIFLPAPISALLFIGITMIVWLEPKRLTPTLRYRAKSLIIVVTLLISFCIISFQYILFTPVGQNTINGMQGRYFLPLLPLFIWLLPPVKSERPEILAKLVFATSLFGLIATTMQLATAYYVQL
jgi:uncharacterized membrane protein